MTKGKQRERQTHKSYYKQKKIHRQRGRQSHKSYNKQNRRTDREKDNHTRVTASKVEKTERKPFTQELKQTKQTERKTNKQDIQQPK